MTTPTGTNIFTMARHLRADGTIPARVPSTDHRHLVRCIDGGLLEVQGKTITITEAGIEALKAESWHPTSAAALELIGR